MNNIWLIHILFQFWLLTRKINMFAFLNQFAIRLFLNLISRNVFQIEIDLNL